MTRYRSTTFPLAATMGLIVSLLLAGCGDSSTTTAQFAPSTTAPVAGLVKLAQGRASGTQVAVDVLIFGPEPALDLNAFQFAVKVSDPSAVRFLPQATYAQSALVAGPGQSIAFDVDGTSDPSLVQIEIVKKGGGAGNGFASPSAVVIELPFEVLDPRGSSLTLVGLGNAEARAFDSLRVPIEAVVFDRASAGLFSVTTGGGY